MAFILSLETSTPVCSVALHQNGVLLGVKEIDQPGAHSERLIGLIEDLLKDSNLETSQLGAIAVSEGPGSYTGLRIGVSTAKGLAFAFGIPLLGVSTLAAQARGVGAELENDAVIVSMLDARRMEVYREIFDKDQNSIKFLEAEEINELSYSEFLDRGKVYFIGDAVVKVREIISHKNAVFIDKSISAVEVGEIAWLKYQKSEFEDLAYFTPNYLKEFKVLKSKKNPLLLS